MQNDKIVSLSEYLKAEKREARDDWKTRLGFEEKVRSEYVKYSNLVSLTTSRSELEEISKKVRSIMRIFEELEVDKPFYLGDVPEGYLTPTWSNIAKTWKPKYTVIRKDIKFKLKTLPEEVTINVTDQTKVDKPAPFKKDKTIASEVKCGIEELIIRLDRKRGWRYSFKEEEDFRGFVEVLEHYFSGEEVKLPANTIYLQRRCKTNLAQALFTAYNRYGREKGGPKNDIGFLQVIRMLDQFSDMDDQRLYECLSRKGKLD